METTAIRKVNPTTLKQVREHIDFIYDITNSDAGYTGSMSGNGSRFRHIVYIMVGRGIIQEGKVGKMYNYKWNPDAPAPTKVLYGSIAQQTVDEERVWQKKSIEKKREAQKRETVSPATECETTGDKHAGAEESICRSTLSLFSVQELWDELKKRGCYIEDGRLAIKTIQYYE